MGKLMQASAQYIDALQFDTLSNGFTIRVDGADENKTGTSPKLLLLHGLIGCTGMDVVSILAKMKVDYKNLRIEAATEQTEEHPKVFQDILLTYRLTTAADNEEKVRKAITLSMEKYCGVSAMLAKNSAIRFELFIDEE